MSSILSLVFGYAISGFSLQYLHSKKTFAKKKANGKEDGKKIGSAKGMENNKNYNLTESSICSGK